MTKKVKLTALLLFLAILFCSVSLSILLFSKKAYAAEWEDVSYQTEYNLGDTITLLDRKIIIDDNEYGSNVSLIYPDGTTTALDTVVLTQSGNYKIKYTANIDGKPYYDIVPFVVKYKTITFGENSSVSYGKHKLANEKSGLLVRLQEGDVLEFSPIIDLDELKPTDAIINFFATPDLASVMDFGLLYLKLTDISDPENYLTISITQSFEGADFPHSYVKAGGNGQLMEGWEHGKNALHRGGDGGTPVYHNFGSCTYGYKPVSADGWNISIFYDSQTKTVYVNDFFVIDLDSTDYYNDLWEGFKSNKVRLSVYAEDYRGTNTANFCLSQVYGLKLNESLISEKMFDVNAPVITVYNDYDVMPIAQTGKEYTIPEATAVDDFCGAVNVSTKVYYNYYSNNAVSVNIIDGKVIPKYAGLYTVLYKAVDQAGNEKIETLNFNAYTQIQPLEIYVENYTDNAKCGEYVPLLTPTITGGSGKTSFRLSVQFEGKDIECSSGFIPEKAGTYRVNYVATDYINSYDDFSYNVEVVANPEYVFNSIPVYPKVMVSGSSYEFPVYFIDDYTTGEHEKHKTNIVITDKTGTHTIESGARFTPQVNTSGEKVKIKYVYGNYASQEIEIPTIFAKVMESGRAKLHMENYLYGEGFSTITDESGITVVAGEFETCKWTFANALLWKNFNIDIESIVGASDFEKITIYMADYDNADNTVKIEIENHGSYSNLVVGDERIASNFGFSANAKQTSLTLEYQDGNFVVGTYKAKIYKTVNGEDFKGFNSNKIWLSVELTGATVGSAYKMTNIAGQPMSNLSRDRVSPMITYVGEHGGSISLGASYKIPNVIIASDVLDPNVEFTLTVKKDGAILTDENGVKLQNVNPFGDYTVKLSQYGQYTFFYTASDMAGNSGSYNYSVNVEDDVKPVIKLSKNFVSTAKVGDIITFPSLTVSDNVTAAKDIVITKFVLTSSGILVSVDGNAFRVANSGIYEFQIYAYDEAGNMTYYYAKVNVSR